MALNRTGNEGSGIFCFWLAGYIGQKVSFRNFSYKIHKSNSLLFSVIQNHSNYLCAFNDSGSTEIDFNFKGLNYMAKVLKILQTTILNLSFPKLFHIQMTFEFHVITLTSLQTRVICHGLLVCQSCRIRGWSASNFLTWSLMMIPSRRKTIIQRVIPVAIFLPHTDHSD